jgi:16S rRNA (guanine966-N2)-methyltransferase
MFNALGSLEAVDGATVLDLFAGSGALGIEALSRGAAHTTFVDSDLAAVDAVRANLAATGLTAQATVHRREWRSFLTSGATTFGLVLLDPPYDFDAWTELLEALEPPVAGGIVVAESDRPIDPGPAWMVVRAKRYGTTVVSFFEGRAARRPS